MTRTNRKSAEPMGLLAEMLKPYLKELVYDAVSELSEQTKPRPPKPYNVAEVAEYLGIPVSSLYQLTSKEAIPFHKVGRKLLFYQDELDAWIKNGKPKK